MKKKITDKIRNAAFLDTIKQNETKVYELRITESDFNAQAASAYKRWFPWHRHPGMAG